MGWQTDFLRWITSFQNPLVNKFASFFAFAGTESFYLLIVPIIYWCISKSFGFRFLYILLFSLYVNTLIKTNYPVTRPVGVDGIDSIFIESASEEASQYPNDSFPSAHAQGSATFWGYLGYGVKRPSFWILAGVMIFLTSLSRLYSGLHWPIDVISGAVFGIIVLLIGIRLTPIIENLTRPIQWILAIIAPILMGLFFPEPEGIKTSGFLLGAGVAYLIEQKHLRMDLNTPIWKKAIAYLIGIAGLILIQRGLKMILPEHLLADYFRYACMGIWACLGAPWLFALLRLYPTDGHKTIFSGTKITG